MTGFDLLEFISQNLVMMLTGSTMSILGIALYTPVGNAFLSDGLFRNKFEALLIFLVSVPVTALITVGVQFFWEFLVEAISLLNVVGLVLILGMIGVNSCVKNWTFTDLKSIIVYIVGLLFLFV
ncbi:MAG: hypothetical protein PHF18_06270 [Methanosarcina sp.]|uniref:hypothetical protein n=1 Tax=Methanosarcina sp. TaxID=2213 RepID=UPI00260DB0A2|nr:hypothetical protein [Methanosarcina sp.]MDD3246443.1 hypothetical protein [Methanosarcina sp.]